MAWQQDLKAADATLGIEDPEQAAAVLDAQETVLTGQPVSWRDIKRIAREAGEWPRIELRARGTVADPRNPASIAEGATLAAINALASRDEEVIDPASPVFQAGLSAFAVAGDISGATVTAIQALAERRVRKWPVTIDAGLVQTIRAM